MMVLLKRVWIPLVSVLLVTDVFGTESRFSHQLHIKQVGIDCLVCHGAAVTSKVVEDRNLPKKNICLSCHNGGIAPNVDTTWLTEREVEKRTFHFNHEFHLKLGNVTAVIRAALDDGRYLGESLGVRRLLNHDNACQGCHRGLEETNSVTESSLPSMSDCLVCHSEIDNPFSCEECHLPGSTLKPVDHTREFVDLHSTGKLNLNKATCLPCHGTNFSCMGCH
ncbi:MAG: hypothetical protein CMN58_04685 [Solibacterales bacterium]|nr:hypothetical protein [Bryobacterales bacterium]